MHTKYNMHFVNSGIMADEKTTLFFRNSSDVFIHGLLSGKRTGTCSSLPVFLVAIGRRLGYPMRLVVSGGHVFARWDSPDGKERLNVESHGNGYLSHPDEYYKTWPKPITDSQIETESYLKSLTPGEELAIFMDIRSCCLLEHGRIHEAEIALARAHQLMPKSKILLMHMGNVLEKEFDRVFTQKTTPTKR